MFQASIDSDAKGPFSVTVHGPDSETKISMLVIRDANYQCDFTIFRTNDTAIEEFLAIGRAIVDQCEMLAAGSIAPADPFLPSAPPVACDAVATEPSKEEMSAAWDYAMKLTEPQSPF